MTLRNSKVPLPADLSDCRVGSFAIHLYGLPTYQPSGVELFPREPFLRWLPLATDDATLMERYDLQVHGNFPHSGDFNPRHQIIKSRQSIWPEDQVRILA